MPKTHPTYDSSFRQEAVNLLISGRRPLKTVVGETGALGGNGSSKTDRAHGDERHDGFSIHGFHSQ